MNEEQKQAIIHYGKTIKTKGWRAGESLIKEYSKKFPDFEKWAWALGIWLRADEILEERSRK